MLLHAFGLFVGSVILWRLLFAGWMRDSVPGIAAVPALFALGFLGGVGLYQLSTLAHDGGHGALGRTRLGSLVTGILASSAVPGYLGVAYMLTHWPHHRFTNTVRDPQAPWLASFNRPVIARPLRFFEIGVKATYYFFIDAMNLYTDRAQQRSMRLPTPVARRLVVLNLFANAAFIALYTAAWVVDRPLFVLAVLIPWLWYFLIFGLYVFLEHGDTDVGARMAWSHTHPVFRCLALGDSYHLEHHLYPGVQKTRLRAVHAYLRQTRFHNAQKCLIERCLLRSIRLAFRSSYPIVRVRLPGFNAAKEHEETN